LTDFSSHIAGDPAVKGGPLMCLLLVGRRDDHHEGRPRRSLFKTMKGVFTTAGGVTNS